MDNPLAGWQVEIDLFFAADRAYFPLEGSKEQVQPVLDAEFPGVEVEWVEDASNGIYGVTLTPELHSLLMSEGGFSIDRGGVRIQAEFDQH